MKIKCGKSEKGYFLGVTPLGEESSLQAMCRQARAWAPKSARSMSVHEVSSSRYELDFLVTYYTTLTEGDHLVECAPSRLARGHQE